MFLKKSLLGALLVVFSCSSVHTAEIGSTFTERLIDVARKSAVELVVFIPTILIIHRLVARKCKVCQHYNCSCLPQENQIRCECKPEHIWEHVLPDFVWDAHREF